eukprot:TRINITY_DN47326_c0_g1_i1.p1 TRINITY_DN47326_c0_g1~~TRINITY_DN47326_c0_g1_i1.p1  ORF type:complete len:400 (+),score=63.43 TRINITY_DN47326_c0_g1_i1:64-1200(+)
MTQEKHYGSNTHGGKGAPSQHLTQAEKQLKKEQKELYYAVGRLATYFENRKDANCAADAASSCLNRLHAHGLRFVVNTYSKDDAETLSRAHDAAKAAKEAELGSETAALLKDHTELFEQLGVNRGILESLTDSTMACGEREDSTPCSVPVCQVTVAARPNPVEVNDEGFEEISLARGHRLVGSHSSFAKGLRPLVQKIAEKIDTAVLTFCPGKLSQDSTYATTARLQPQVSRGQTLHFAWRSGEQVQELRIVVKDGGDVEQVQRQIEEIAVATPNRKPAGKLEKKRTARMEATPQNSKLEQEREWSAINKVHLIAAHRKKLQKQAEKAAEGKAKERAKKLLAAHGNRGDVSKKNVKEYAARDERIVSGESRSKHSMRK